MSNLITFIISGVGIAALIADTLRDTRPGG